MYMNVVQSVRFRIKVKLCEAIVYMKGAIYRRFQNVIRTDSDTRMITFN